MREEKRGRITSSNLLVTHCFSCSPGYVWLSELQVHNAKTLNFSSSMSPNSVFRAALGLDSPAYVLGIAPTQVQDLALGLVKLHEVPTDPSPKPVKVPLDGIPYLQCVYCTTQRGGVDKPELVQSVFSQ
ncbi:hypothetical protein HGM15179_006408 [Zosterops borbonicus]|uniref:Uncharacterized protein n=1 Tax=Zosterops borbonicus TaxID=364589 RepID=A0A8K1GKH3_9PASS|nr:hypothetical protein HGM15179_006408 [Zosterops borbonicus]